MSLFRERDDILIKVLVGHDDTEDAPCIIAVNGHIGLDQLEKIEEQLADSEVMDFSKGAGEYVYQAYFMQEQSTDGYVEFPAYWELTEISHEVPEWMTITHLPHSTLPKETNMCPYCHRINCGADDVFDRCIPF